jgi:aldose sugar dehydrogenase
MALSGCSPSTALPPKTTTTPVPTLPANLLAPDLKSKSPDVLYIRVNIDTGRRELWFNTIVVNVGDGPLELVGINDQSTNQTRAVQRIKTKEGGFEERTAGYFVFHPDHDHWHFENFVEFEIFSLDSEGRQVALVSTTGKTTYCVHDMMRLSPALPNSPETAAYPACSSQIQGLSAGWMDTYIETLPGQQLEIEDLPDGRYAILSSADPANLVLEKNENNNSSTIIVEIKGMEIDIVSPVSAIPAVINTQVFIGNLDVPWAIDFVPDGRMFVTERPGRIRVIKTGILQEEPWMTLDVTAVGEGGLLGLAVDPNFTKNHYVYIAYTYSTGGSLRNRLVRLREDPATGKGVLDKILLDNVSGGSIHDGGRVKFGPDGKLYWTIGEAGNPALAQDTSSSNGKILRLNPDGTVPDDNPFRGSPVYSYGHRNPQGLAWQPGTNRLYATEHGPSGGAYGVGQDEVNYIEPGKNYGWPSIIGDAARENMISPVIQSGESETWAPGGAAFINGGPWDGSLIFTGLRGQSLYRLVPDKNDPRKVVTFEKLLAGQYGRLRDVVQGPDGAIYILTNNRDGRGSPQPGDDKILRLTLK